MNHRPNHIPRWERNTNIFLSAIILVYGIYGLWMDDIIVPGRHGNNSHLHGEPAILMFAAMCCAVLNMLSVVVDHYDRRNNAILYRIFAWAMWLAAWILFSSALLSQD